MIFLWAILGSLLPSLLRFGILLLKTLKRKERIDWKGLLLPATYDWLPFLGLSLFIALLIALLTGGYRNLDTFLLFLSFGLLPLFLKVTRLSLLLKKKERIHLRPLILGSLTFLYLMLECFAFNARAYKGYGEGNAYEAKDFYSLHYRYSDSNKDKHYTETQLESDAISIDKSSSKNLFYFTPKEETRSNLLLHFAPDTPSAEIKVSFWSLKSDAKENPEGKESWTDNDWNFLGAYYTNPKMADSLYLPFLGSEGPLKVLFEIDGGRYNPPDKVTLLSLTSNEKLLFSYSEVRAVLTLGLLYTIAYLPSILCRNKKENPSRLPYLVLLGAGVLSALIVLIVGSVDKEAFTTEYSYIAENAANANYSLVTIYDRLVLAFNKGNIKLDAFLDQRLLSMENPYDRAARDALGIRALWDHAYYKGSYYCYYGLAPVISFLYPYFLLSGKTLVPNTLFGSLFGLSFLIPIYLILLLEITRYIHGSVDWRAFIFLSFVSIFASNLLGNLCLKDAYFHEGIYHLPILYGILYSDLFFLFVLLARRNEKWRPIYLALAGLSFVFVILSRPSLFLISVIALPLLLAMLLAKDRGYKNKLLDFLPMGAILLIGAILVCLYNYARFESIFEFGQSYQINYDQTHMSYTLGKLFPSLIHFLFTPPSPSSSFPFLGGTAFSLPFDDVLYNNTYIGPIWTLWLLFAFVAPFLLKGKEHREKRAFLGLIVLMTLLLMYTTYSKAGICLRYTLEIYHILSLGALGGALLLLEKGEKKGGFGYAPLLCGFGVAAIFLGTALFFNHFDGISRGDLNGLYFHFEEAFGKYNF